MQFKIRTEFYFQKQFYFKLLSSVKPFFFKQFSLAFICSLVLFNPKIGTYQVLPFRVRVNQGATA